MAKIEYTVHTTVYVDDALIATIQQQAETMLPSMLCRIIMDKTGYPLYVANCIRKAVTQNTNEFNIQYGYGLDE